MINQAKALSLARQIKAVIFDVDGVLTSGIEYLLPHGEVIKARNYIDGQGISLLRAIGLQIAFITNEPEKSASGEFIKHLVEKWNNLPSSCQPDNPKGWPLIRLYTSDDRKENKSDLLHQYLAEIKIEAKDCAVMGDDLVDVSMLKLAGFKIAPAQAEIIIKQMTDWITERPGGAGAIRDLANFILKAREINPLDLASS